MSATNTITSDGKSRVVLATSRDYKPWIEYIRPQIGEHNWRRWIEPYAGHLHEDAPTKPQAPAQETYIASYRKDLDAWTVYLNRPPPTGGVGTRTQAATATPPVNPIEEQRNNPQAYNLEISEGVTFDRAIRIHNMRLAEYTILARDWEKCVQVLNESVTPEARKNYQASDTLFTKVNHLKEAFAPDDGNLLLSSMKSYAAVHAKPPKKDSTMAIKLKWLDSWNSAMIDGFESGVPQCLNITLWTMELIRALQDAAPSTTNALIHTPESLKKNAHPGELTYRDIYSSLLREWQYKEHAAPATTYSHAAGGSSYLAAGGHSNSLGEAGSKIASNQRSIPGALHEEVQIGSRYGGKHARNATVDDRSRCMACGHRRHTIERCWYVFENLRSRQWTEEGDLELYQHWCQAKDTPKVLEWIRYSAGRPKVEDSSR